MQYWRQENIVWDKGFRAEQQAEFWADREPTARECVDAAKILERTVLGSDPRIMEWGGAREK